MLVHEAERSFQLGIDALSRGKKRDALAFFGGAIEIESQSGPRHIQARYLSYYGLCLALTGGDLHEAIRRCRQAARSEGYRPDICWNLGRVLMAADRRREAYKALQRGLRLQPGHRGIQRDLARMGIRRRPVIPFLGRRSPINVFLGRLLRSVRSSGAQTPAAPRLATRRPRAAAPAPPPVTADAAEDAARAAVEGYSRTTEPEVAHQTS